MDLDISSQWDYIYEYWKERDPSPKTSKNELLIQLNERVNYVNNKFSILMPGWKTDRGEIYIIYGPPYSVDSYYDNRRMINFETWYYSDKEFIFSDERSFGEMQLIKQF